MKVAKKRKPRPQKAPGICEFLRMALESAVETEKRIEKFIPEINVISSNRIFEIPHLKDLLNCHAEIIQLLNKEAKLMAEIQDWVQKHEAGDYAN